jgi:hypothetical protein
MYNPVINAIFDKRTEIHYNEWHISTPTGKVKIELQGKIKCPLLNESISSLACSKLMDRPDWPRGIDPEVCNKCDCYIALSIRKFQNQKTKG